MSVESPPSADSGSRPIMLRLSLFYFCYFGALGIFAPHWPPFLLSLGLTPVELGSVTAVFFGARIVAPLFWGWLADVSGRRVLVTRVAAFFTLAAFCLIFEYQSYRALLIITLLYSAFWTATLPQFEAITLSALKGREQHYGRVRLWGSVGFVVVALLTGVARQQFGNSAVPVIAAITLLLIWLCTFLVGEQPRALQLAARGALRRTLKRPAVLALLLLCLVLQLAHAPYYVFFSVYLENRGYSETAVSLLWNLGVAAEIALFIVMARLLPRFGVIRLFQATVLLSALRWFMLGFNVEFLPWLIAAQLLHMVSFGLYHATAVHVINEYFTGAVQGRGQAIYSAATFGLGSSIGAWLSGHGYEAIGASGVFYAAAVITLLAWPLVGLLRRTSGQPAAQSPAEML